ncbi:hypothetical protein CYY_000908 [Polysphondylium violaceum]|uniref:Nonsense-mediated mRNA decay factor SMG8 n=1 Tax=Polysphondylium violaceum TaxID=133409 RepID=A0A8J4Q3Z3_9MYCE|nr:hypothetical protein CYY_000908 [Polysphondylium violaceum]
MNETIATNKVYSLKERKRTTGTKVVYVPKYSSSSSSSSDPIHIIGTDSVSSNTNTTSSSTAAPNSNNESSNKITNNTTINNSGNSNNNNNNNNNNNDPDFKPTCVIGVIGDSSRGKSLFLNRMVESSQFHELNIQFNKHTPEETIRFEMYHNKENQNVYINLNSFNDTKVFTDVWNGIKNVSPYDVEKWLEDSEVVYLKSLLLLFNICNIVFVIFESLTLKLEYFNLFKILKYLKNNHLVLPTSIPEPFSFLSVGKTIPMLQMFLVKDLTENYERASHLKLEESLKKQATILLKHNQLFHTISGCGGNAGIRKLDANQQPLFFVETSKPFVRLIRLYQMSTSAIKALISSNKTASYSSVPFNKQLKYFNQLVGSYESTSHNVPLLFIKAFKNSMHSLELEFTSFRVWKEYLERLSLALDTSTMFSSFTYSPNLRFSSKTCSMHTKWALEQYSDTTLPLTYGAKIHQSRLNKAIKYLCLNANGPALETFIQSLRNDCDQIWRRGRKICEAESATGRICTLKTHIIPPLPGSILPPPTQPIIPSIMKEHTDERPHSSGYRTRATCNCGRTTSIREDIFEIEFGNLLFYMQPCCLDTPLLKISNTQLLFHPSKSNSSIQYTTPFPWFSVLDYGAVRKPPAEMEPAFFINNELNLQDWEIKKIPTVYSQRPPLDAQNYLSYEYQCPTGHRFIERKRSKKFFIKHRNPAEIQVFYQRLMLEKCPASDCNYYSQLSRVYLTTDIDKTVTIKPTIEIYQSEKQPCDVWSYTMDSFALTKSHLHSIRLPFVFDFENTPVLLTTPQTSSFILNVTFTQPPLVDQQ